MRKISLIILLFLVGALSLNAQMRDLDPPTSVSVDVSSGLVTWGQPLIGEWYTWSTGEVWDGIGLTEGGNMYVASRWDEENLGDLDGYFLTRVKLFLNSYVEGINTSSDFAVKVWIGDNASTLVLEQAFTPVFNEWNEIILDSTILIDSDMELWFGYSFNCASNEFPAGIDNGPVVADYGDMVSTNGITWNSLYGLNSDLDSNWLLNGYICNSAGREIDFNIHADNPSKLIDRDRPLIGYNVYLDGEFIVNTPDTEYQLQELTSNQQYTVGVAAQYTDGESQHSEISFIYAGLDANTDMNPATYYHGNFPNPFNPTTNIEFSITHDNTNTELTIYNAKGQKIKDLMNSKMTSGTHSILWDGTDSSNLPVSSGIYYYILKRGSKFDSNKMILLK